MELDKKFVVFVVLIILSLTAIRIFSWNQEAQTFNKFKNPDQPEATIWDAMFSELRVE